MKASKFKEFSIYLACFLLTAFAIIILNILFSCELMSQYIKDSSWIPNVVDTITTGFIFIIGNRISNKDSLRDEIATQKKEYEVICNAVCRIQSALNIKRFQRVFIFSLSPDTDTCTLMQGIINVQKEIQDSIAAFVKIKHLIHDEELLCEFNDTVKIIESSFQDVLDGLVIIVNKWGEIISKQKEVESVVDEIELKNDHHQFTCAKYNNYKVLESQKQKFIKTFNAQEPTMNNLIRGLEKASTQLLNSELTILKNLENKL